MNMFLPALAEFLIGIFIRAKCTIFESRFCSNLLFSPRLLSENRFTLFGRRLRIILTIDEGQQIYFAHFAKLFAYCDKII